MRPSKFDLALGIAVCSLVVICCVGAVVAGIVEVLR
jgi:hypothetical protein